MIKHFLLMASVVALLCACSAEQIITDLFDDNKTEISAKLQLSFTDNATLQKLKLNANQIGNTRATFDLDLVDTPLSNGSSYKKLEYGTPHINEGQDMICVFREKHTNETFQHKFSAVTGNEGNFDKEFSFKTALTKENIKNGEWYVMCFTSKHMEDGKLSIPKPPHTWAGKSDGTEDFDKLTKTPDMDIPFASLWKKVEVSETDGKITFSSNKKVVLRMLGTLLDLNIFKIPESNNIIVHNLTLISSGDTKGDLIITPEAAKNISLDYTSEDDDDELSKQKENAKTAGYQAIIDAMWQGTSEKVTESNLTYTHYDIENPEREFKLIKGAQREIKTDKVTNTSTLIGVPNYRHDLFWFVMKESNRGEHEKADERAKNVKRYKTQFLLHGTVERQNDAQASSLNKAIKRTFAVTRSTTASGGITSTKETEANTYTSYPFWGTKYPFETGNVYRSQATPKETPTGPVDAIFKENLKSRNNENYFSPEEMQVHIGNSFNIDGDPSKGIPANLHVPSRLEWQNIFPRCMNTNEPIATISLGQISSSAFVKFAHYAHNHTNASKNYTHIVTFKALPKDKIKGMFNFDDYDKNWKAERETGFAYAESDYTDPNIYPWATPYPDDFMNSGKLEKYSEDKSEGLITLTNNYNQYAIHIAYKDNKMVLTQRFLGNDFILDPFDIDTDKYWNYTGNTGITPLSKQEVQRELPLLGYQEYNKESEDDENVQGRIINDGKIAIYWTRTDPKTEEDANEEMTHSLLPLYINTKDKSQWWRTDNTGDKTELYKVVEDEDGNITEIKAKFSAMIRPFKYLTE